MNDRMEGQGQYFFATGDFYRGDFLLDRPHGEGTAVYASGASFSGQFREGVPCGRGVMTVGDEEWRGQWLAGKRVDSEASP